MASSFPHFYTDPNNIPPNVYCNYSNYPLADAGDDYGGTTLWGLENLTLHNGEVQPESYKAASSAYPVQLGPSDMVVPTYTDYTANACGGIAGMECYGAAVYDQPNVSEYGEDYGGFVPEFKPPLQRSCCSDYMGFQGNPAGHGAEEPNNAKKVVGKYSVEERKDRILRYLKKRHLRNFNKTIKYACRKTLADRRVRVRGRFARNNELSDDEMAMKMNNLHPDNDQLFFGDSVKMKHDEEEEWLQEVQVWLIS